MSFCGISKLIHCFLANNDFTDIIEATFEHMLERRRFGVNSSGVITLDVFREPIVLEAQTNYLSENFPCRVDEKTEENDNSSENGGRGNDFEHLKIQISRTADILENDVIIFPIGSNDTYRVIKDINLETIPKRYIYCTKEFRATQ